MKRRTALRRSWMQVHLWLGLTLGVLAAVLGVTGSALVYDHELDSWIHPYRYAIGPGGATLAYADYVQRAAEVLAPQSRPVALRLPDGEPAPVVVLARGSGNAGVQRIYLDPGSGSVLDIGSSRDLIGWLHEFHGSLQLREYSGREIVGSVGLALLVSALSGIYLWWPVRGISRAALGFRRGMPLSRNLHYTVGFWSALVLAVLAFTGAFIAFPDAGRSAVGLFASVSVPGRGVQAQQSSGSVIGADAAGRIAIAAYAGARVVTIGLPAGPRGVYRITLREAGDTTPRAGTVVIVDAGSGAVLHRTDRSTQRSGDRFILWQRIIHEGSAFGAVGRLTTFLGGLLPALLMATGLLMWLRRRVGRGAPRTRLDRRFPPTAKSRNTAGA